MGQANPKIDHVLSDFGLTEPEVAVYRAVLELGARPASIIAQKARLKRGQTYNVLASLIERGIVQEFEKNGVRHFTASPPKSLVSVVENQEMELAARKEKLIDILPELEKLMKPAISRGRVRYYQGVEGVKEIFEDLIRVPGQPIYALVDFDYTWSLKRDAIQRWMMSWIKRRKENEIWYYGILNKSAGSDLAVSTREAHKRELKMVQNLHLPVEINVYGPKVAVVSTNEETMGVVIEHEGLATTLKNLHQAVWSILPQYTLG